MTTRCHRRGDAPSMMNDPLVQLDKRICQTKYKSGHFDIFCICQVISISIMNSMDNQLSTTIRRVPACFQNSAGPACPLFPSWGVYFLSLSQDLRSRPMKQNWQRVHPHQALFFPLGYPRRQPHSLHHSTLMSRNMLRL